MIIDPKLECSSDHLSATRLGSTSEMHAGLVPRIRYKSSQEWFAVSVHVYQGIRVWRLRSITSRPKQYTCPASVEPIENVNSMNSKHV